MPRTSWVPGLAKSSCLLLLAVAWIAPVKAAESQGAAAPGSFRAAQDQGLDLSLRPVDLLNMESGAAHGSFRAAQDAGAADSRARWVREGFPGVEGSPTWAGDKEESEGLRMLRRF